MDTNQRLVRARVAIMRDPRFVAIAGVMMVGECRLVPGIPTAVTNGRDVFIGAEFAAKLDDEVLRFVLLHEYYHIMLMHMITWKHLFKEDAQTANLAADAVINVMLDKLAGPRVDGFLRVWEDAILDYQYDGMDTLAVYNLMRKQGTPQQRSASGGKAEDFDEHDASGAGVPELTEDEQEQVAKDVDTAVRQAVQMAGRMGGNVDRALTNLLQVTVPWEDELQDFVKTTAAGSDFSSWRKLSRRWMARDMKMPSRFSETAKRITIGVDTSASIGDDQLRRALTEIQAACDSVSPEVVDVIYWDYSVASHETYERDSLTTLVESTRPKGGGGTRVGSMLDYMKAHDIRPDCVIVFTDGYVEQDWGGNDWPAPVLWAVSTKGIRAPHGKTLHVPV